MGVQDLSYWRQNSWELLPELCPCDIHFGEYLDARDLGGRTLFHFGTGLHHVVGRHNASLPSPNQILAVTVSPREFQSYIDLLAERPEVGITYKVLFADIYTLSAELLPEFDLVTLFHLCEYFSPETASYAPLDDGSLLDMFLNRLRVGGRLVFYRGSDGYPGTKPLIEDAVDAGTMTHLEDFHSLAVYERL